MKFSTSAACLVCFAGVAFAQIILPTPCQEVTVKQHFHPRAYLGRWYEYKKFFTYFERDGKCVSATYSENKNGTIRVRNYIVNATNDKNLFVIGSASLSGKYGEGKLTVGFPNSGPDRGSNYLILDTDYKRFSVVWSCVNLGPAQSLQFAWVLTRKRFPGALTLARAESVILANRINAARFLLTDQTNCPPDHL